MLDIRRLRDEYDAVLASVASRGQGDFGLPRVMELDEQRRSILASLEQMKNKQNQDSKEIPRLKKEGMDTTGLMAEMKELSDQIKELDTKGMLKVLRQGRAIWYAPDQDYGRKQSLFVPLFGIEAATVTATSKFARLGRALVVPFTQERLADGSGYRLVVHPPLADFPGESEEADCLRINQWVEQAVRACPEQYLWAHRRFKTRPEGAPKLY